MPPGGPLRRYWIEKDSLAGGSCPTTGDLPRLQEAGFDVLISLLDDDGQADYRPGDVPPPLRWYNVPMRDHATPGLGQLAAFYDVLWSHPRPKRALVHCYAGIGRTGTVAASYLVWRGRSVDESVERVNDWTDGGFAREIRGREEEVRALLRRFRALFPPPAAIR